jgi:hypothetical protein
VAAPEWARSASHCHVSQSYWSMSAGWDPHPYRPDKWAPPVCHVAGCQSAMSHYQSHVAYLHWSTSIASIKNTDTWQAMTKPPQHHMTHGNILYSHLIQQLDKWQHAIRPPQQPSAMWPFPIGPPHHCGPHHTTR